MKLLIGDGDRLSLSLGANFPEDFRGDDSFCGDFGGVVRAFIGDSVADNSDVLDAFFLGVIADFGSDSVAINSSTYD